MTLRVLYHLTEGCCCCPQVNSVLSGGGLAGDGDATSYCGRYRLVISGYCRTRGGGIRDSYLWFMSLCLSTGWLDSSVAYEGKHQCVCVCVCVRARVKTVLVLNYSSSLRMI